MNEQAWITVNASGSMRLTKARPAMRWDEISLQIDVTIPDEMFRRPHLQASIKVPDEAVQQRVISTDVIDNVQESIRQATGLEIAVKVVKKCAFPGCNEDANFGVNCAQHAPSTDTGT